MYKRVMVWIFSGWMMLNFCGCLGAFLVGGAVGAGGAAWLSGKLSEEFHATYAATVDASKKAVHDLNLQITKESENANNASIKGVYTDGRDYWIDIHRDTEQASKVAVRVGGVTSDKAAAQTIMSKIEEYLRKTG